MDDVASDLNAEVTADGAGQRVGGVGGAEHLATGLDHIQTLPHHGHHGAGVHVVHESGEEGAGGQISVVLLQQLLGGPGELQGDQLEALLLEALDDLADEPALDA